jgi:hypothetical protein
MNANIDISNLKTHFFCDLKKNSSFIHKKIKSKIVSLNFYSKNEANISTIITKIPYYFHYFHTIEDYDFVNINDINEKMSEKLSLSNDNKYLIFKYKNGYFVPFQEFLYNIESPKRFIFFSLDSFSNLLNSLIKLNENNICFFDLCPQNLFFSSDKPIIHNFQLSLQIQLLNESYITNIMKGIGDYTYKPLEIHILFYFVYNDINTISYSFIEEIMEKYLNNLSILNLFSDSYRDSYKEECFTFLKRYINKPKTEIINEILKYNNKWDVFSLSLIYLHIFGNLSRVFSLKQSFISKITLELSKNIHPNPSKRSSLMQVKETIEKLFESNFDWNFVEQVDTNKMSLLLTELER